MMHYNNTLGLNGDIGVIFKQLNSALQSKKLIDRIPKIIGLKIVEKEKEWNDFKNRIYQNEVLKEMPFRDLLTQLLQ